MITVTDTLLTGYRTGGIKAAAVLHGLLYGTWEASLLMCQSFAGILILSGDCSSKDIQFILQLNSNEVKVGITYQYDENAQSRDLSDGENIMEFSQLEARSFAMSCGAERGEKWGEAGFYYRNMNYSETSKPEDREITIGEVIFYHKETKSLP